MAEIKATMSMRELRDWQWFDAVHEPLPDRLADIHNGIIASMMVNIMRSADSAPLTPADFFVIRDRTAPSEPEVPEIERLRAQWRGG